MLWRLYSIMKYYTLFISGWWFGTFFIFHILGRIFPTDFHIFQRDSNHQPDIVLDTIPSGNLT